MVGLTRKTLARSIAAAMPKRNEKPKRCRDLLYAKAIRDLVKGRLSALAVASQQNTSACYQGIPQGSLEEPTTGTEEDLGVATEAVQ